MTHEPYTLDEIQEIELMREELGMCRLRRMAISFSGGRTSAVMTKAVWEDYEMRRDDHHVVITFANTGQEHEATLDFVHRCETEFGWPVVWLEAVVDPEKGKGIRHRIVDYHTANRDGAVFEAAIAKYGIFNPTVKSCTTRLKIEVMKSYLKSLGWAFSGEWAKDHKTCIGIRADEYDRILEDADAKNVIYPLAARGYTKRDVALEIQSWGFDLQIPNDAYGNCVTCWKKSDRKLMTILHQEPHRFDFFRAMEAKYGDHKCTEASRGPDGRRHWFRGHRDVIDLENKLKAQLAAGTFEPYVDDPYEHGIEFDPDMDTDSACGESCEIGADYVPELNDSDSDEEVEEEKETNGRDEPQWGAHSIPPIRPQ